MNRHLISSAIIGLALIGGAIAILWNLPFEQAIDQFALADSTFATSTLIWSYTPVEQLVFGGKGGFSISWINGIVEVEYDNVTEAAALFFEFLKDYIDDNYWIIPRDKDYCWFYLSPYQGALTLVYAYDTVATYNGVLGQDEIEQYAKGLGYKTWR